MNIDTEPIQEAEPVVEIPSPTPEEPEVVQINEEAEGEKDEIEFDE